jgi:hypothetical protein
MHHCLQAKGPIQSCWSSIYESYARERHESHHHLFCHCYHHNPLNLMVAAVVVDHATLEPKRNSIRSTLLVLALVDSSTLC